MAQIVASLMAFDAVGHSSPWARFLRGLFNGGDGQELLAHVLDSDEDMAQLTIVDYGVGGSVGNLKTEDDFREDEAWKAAQGEVRLLRALVALDGMGVASAFGKGGLYSSLRPVAHSPSATRMLLRLRGPLGLAFAFSVRDTKWLTEVLGIASEKILKDTFHVYVL